MTIKMLLATFGTLAMLSGGAAHAQAVSTDKPAATAKVKAPRTAKSLDCSKQADEKGLRGKARKKFRSQCKRA